MRASLLCLVALVAAGAAHAASPHEMVLTIPEGAIQELLDRASPIEGKTPEGLRYSIDKPHVQIREGHIYTTMSIALSGGITVLGQELGVNLSGSLDGEIVVRLDPRTRSIKGGLEIRRLSIKNLEDLSDADDVKTFLSENLTRFDYPLDLGEAVLPELRLLLSGEITGVEVADGRVLVRARLLAKRGG
ncbi:MAG: hypothetical protein U0166_18980 [Acidobacteriota bacterium]